MNVSAWSRTQVRRRRRAGFTLMEVLLVLVILVILGSLAVGAYTRVQGKANINAAKSQIGLFRGPIDNYHLDMNEYPTTSQGLEAIVAAPQDASSPEDWGGPYLEPAQVPMDPWNRPYQYACPGKMNPDSFDVWSLGPDGQNGTADDIGNWADQPATTGG